ncbi:MAG: S-layer homology domain-containing protein [Defluviitaleaceae bacterium]|nr:S-layer homology domain-containing protein [Defluviitaleaceae bacterium]
MKRTKRNLQLFAMVLTLVMTFGVIPVPVLAETDAGIIYNTVGATYIEPNATTPSALVSYLPTPVSGDYESSMPTSDSITVFVSFEGYNLGHGFYIEPTPVTVPAGSFADYPTIMLLTNQGHTFSGDPGPMFFLDNISGFNRGFMDPPQYITIDLIDDTNEGGSLSMFMYSSESSWMLAINNEIGNVGPGAWVVNDGDVLRWQFSLQGWGADIGLPSEWFTPLFEHADKTQLIRALFLPEINQNARQNALDIIINPLATTAEVAYALAALTDASDPGSGSGEPTDPSDPDDLPSTLEYYEAMMHSLSWIRANIPNPTVGNVGGEWAVLALARAGVVDDAWFAHYLESLANSPNVVSWMDHQRVVIALTALGINASNHNGHDFLANFRTFVPISERSVHSRTINADTFALIALDSMPYSNDRTPFVTSILDAQRQNGSWGLTATATPGIDITAMAIQALAPYYRNNHSGVRTAVNNAVDWISQQDVLDVEGNAQVIIALAALGRNATDYVDALLIFFDEATGGFRRGTIVDAMATEQAANALIAYHRFRTGQNSLFDMRDAFADGSSGGGATPPGGGVTIPVNRATLFNEIARAEELEESDFTQGSWADLQTMLSTARQIAQNQNVTQAQIDTALLNLRQAISDLERIDTAAQGRAFISVIDPSAGPNQTGIFFAGEWFYLEPDETAYSLLRRTGLNIRSRGNAALGGMYVESINGFGEFDDGPLSGWWYRVNGVRPTFSASMYNLQDGDRVEWVFTRDLGEDVDSNYNDNDPIYEELLPELYELYEVETEEYSYDLPNVPNLADEYQAEEESYIDNISRVDNETTPVIDLPFLAPVTGWINPFTDVSEDDWFYYNVQFVYLNGIMSGTSFDEFSPNANLTRGMIVTMLWRLEGSPIAEHSIAFSDVQPEQWYFNAIAWAGENGIVSGYGGGLFGPSDNASREQLATILRNYVHFLGLSATADSFVNDFDDVDAISPWALEAMKWANARGIISGRTQTILAPGEAVTRAESATMLRQFVALSLT